MIFAIDFDGTLCEHVFPAIGEPKMCTIGFIRDLKNKGHRWLLLTMREGEKLQEALDWLKQFDIEPEVCNDNIEELCCEFCNNPRKVFAHAYIDDRNAGTVEQQISFFRKKYDI